MTDLGTPSGVNEAYASAINTAGQVVGAAFFPVECTSEPLLWENGAVHLLNDLLDPASGWTVVGASDINDMGQIVGIARRGTEPYRAVLLVPIAAPTVDSKSAHDTVVVDEKP